MITSLGVTNPKKKKKMEIKVGKFIYVLSVALEDEYLHWINECEIPQKDYIILEILFTKNTEPKLQQLENELMSIKQGDMMIS